MAFGIPSAWGQSTPNSAGKVSAPKPPPVPKGMAGLTGGLRAQGQPAGMGGLTGAVQKQPGAQQPGNPLAPAAPAAAAPAVTAAPGTTPPQAADPRDAAYWSNVAQNQFKVNNQINQLQSRTGQGHVTLQDNLSKLAQAQALANTRTENAENAAGGFALGNLSQNLGNLNKGYLQQQESANQGFANLKGGNDQNIAALRAGIPIYDNQQFGAAAGRASASAARDNTLGLGAPVDQTAAPIDPANLTPDQIKYITAGMANQSQPQAQAPRPLPTRSNLGRLIKQPAPRARLGTLGPLTKVR